MAMLEGLLAEIKAKRIELEKELETLSNVIEVDFVEKRHDIDNQTYKSCLEMSIEIYKNVEDSITKRIKVRNDSLRVQQFNRGKL